MSESDPLQWWTISGSEFLRALRLVAEGNDPELVYTEFYANSETFRPADPICNERGIPESECPAHCRHTLAIPPVDPDDLCLTCGATNGVCRCPIPPIDGSGR